MDPDLFLFEMKNQPLFLYKVPTNFIRAGRFHISAKKFKFAEDIDCWLRAKCFNNERSLILMSKFNPYTTKKSRSFDRELAVQLEHPKSLAWRSLKQQLSILF